MSRSPVRPFRWSALSRRRTGAGFTMVEMLVALFFVSILMAGLAKVFRSGVKTYVSGSERVGAMRRNRLSLDLMQEELNAAGQFLIALGGGYPPLQTDGFRILPQVDYTDGGKVAVALDNPDDRFSAEISMILDEVLPMEGRLTGLAGGGTATLAGLVASGQDVSQLPGTLEVAFSQEQQATQLQQAFGDGHEVFAIFRNGYECKAVTSGVAASPTSVTLTLSAVLAGDDGTPTGSSGPLFQNVQKNDDRVLFVQRLRRVTYGIQPMKLDPAQEAAIPCLVRRDEGRNEAVLVAEHVIHLGVDLSVDGGRTWVQSRQQDFRTGGDRGSQEQAWTNLKKNLLAQLPAGSQAAQRVAANPSHWFRELPVMVRLRVKTRTSTSREDESVSPGTRRYRVQEQAVILNPKHFGLPF